MDSQFIPKAIDMVKDAIAADNNQDYEVALGLYKKSLEYFMTGLKYENNPVRRGLLLLFPLQYIRSRCRRTPTARLLGSAGIR